MKLREYRNAISTHVDGLADMKLTCGVPVNLLHYETQFAVVRPPDLLFDHASKGWQVIHIKTGRIVGEICKSQSAAIESALKVLRMQIRQNGTKATDERIG